MRAGTQEHQTHEPLISRATLAEVPLAGLFSGELVQIHDDRAIFQESPDELPVIDIQSL